MILQNNKTFRIFDSVKTVKKLPSVHMKINVGAFGDISLEQFDAPRLPEKIYSNDRDFISHVIHVLNKTDESLGVCLTGKPGLGKTFTANIICQKLGLPVIHITKNNSSGILDYINQIQQPHIIYIDEFEKIFPEKNDIDQPLSQESFLSFLDGNMKSNVKRMFIITSNKKINEYMINRPSRLRYLRSYTEISEALIEEIVMDRLEDKSLYEDLRKNITRENLNIDSLIKVIDEINITGKPYSSFKDFFNFKSESTMHSISIVSDQGEKLLTKRKWSPAELVYYFAGDSEFLSQYEAFGTKKIRCDYWFEEVISEDHVDGYLIKGTRDYKLEGKDVEESVVFRVKEVYNMKKYAF